MRNQARIAIFLMMLLLIDSGQALPAANRSPNFLGLNLRVVKALTIAEQAKLKVLFKAKHGLINKLNCKQLQFLKQEALDHLTSVRNEKALMKKKEKKIIRIMAAVEGSVGQKGGVSFIQKAHQSMYSELMDLIGKIDYGDKSADGTTESFFKDAIHGMRHDFELHKLKIQKKLNLAEAKFGLINREFQTHFEFTHTAKHPKTGAFSDSGSRCPGVAIDESCAMIANRNPGTPQGMFQVLNPKTKKKMDTFCNFPKWVKALDYGPEKFGGLPVMLKLEKKSWNSLVPKNAKSLLFVNNGLTGFHLDKLNVGGGFNLNLLCFRLKNKNGEERCHNLQEVTGNGKNRQATIAFDSAPPDWKKLSEKDFSNLDPNTHPCMVSGAESRGFCVNRFELDLRGKSFVGLSDMFSATGQNAEQVVYDFSLFYKY